MFFVGEIYRRNDTMKKDEDEEFDNNIKHEKPMENTHVNYKRLLKEVDKK